MMNNENQKALSVEGVVSEMMDKYATYSDMGVSMHYSGRPEVTGNHLSIDDWLRKTITDRERAWQKHTDKAKEIGFKLGLEKALTKEDDE